MAFGPGSIFWECYGSRLGYLNAPRAGLLQLAYPDLGKGVEQHSDFYNEPFDRLVRSVPQIITTIFGGERAQPTADQIREYHREIKGVHNDGPKVGERYHALDPDTFFWAHATFIETVIASHETFAKPFTLEEKRLLYAEGIEWWRMYGLSMRPVPPTYDDFTDYWQHHLDHVLEATPAASRFAEMFSDPATMNQPWIPMPVWRLLAPAGILPYRWVAIGTMPPQVRELFGFTWNKADQAAFDVFRKSVAMTWPLVPDRLRLLEPARAGYRREGRIGLEAAFKQAAAKQSVSAA